MEMCTSVNINISSFLISLLNFILHYNDKKKNGNPPFLKSVIIYARGVTYKYQ